MVHAGEFLKRVRHEAGLTQEQVAERLGKRQPEVSQVEHRSDVLVSTVDAFVDACGYRWHMEASPAGREYSAGHTG